MKRVLLAVDESEGSRRAAEFVERFFGDLDVAVSAINVAKAPIGWGAPGYGWTPPVPYGSVYGWPFAPRPGDAAGIDAAWERQEREARQVAASQSPPGTAVDVAFGDPVEAIEMAAIEHRAHLIVVGSNDKSLLQRWFGRSVSEELVGDAPCPVLVVPGSDQP